MLAFHVKFALSWVVGVSFVAAGLAPLNRNLQIRNAPGTSSSDTLWALRQTLSSAAAFKRDTIFKNSSSLDTSWNGAVLFSYKGETDHGNTNLFAGVEIVCTTCYIKGTATAQFTINGNFNASQAFHNVTSQLQSTVDNITTTYTKDYLKDTDDFDFPPIQVDFNIDVPDIPECDLQFQFDGMELYMEIDTILSGGATYSLNLYTSETPIGITVGQGLLIGVIFSVDLILSVEAEIDISTGFHIQLHDGVAINIPMFGQNVSTITFNGGNFEFLPVTIQSAGVVLTALLRVGIKAGIDVSTPTVIIDGHSLGFSAGIITGVWADVAKFVTNVTAAGSDSTCELRIVEEYSLLLGANAGATVAILEHTWGPTPNTQIPIWYTTIGDACAVTGNATAAASAAATAITAATISAKGLTTTTISTSVTYTATACLSPGLVNCPVSLQSTSRNTVTKTLVTAVPSGTKASFPVTIQSAVVSSIAFGANIQVISATSGSPVSYIPTASSVTSSIFDGQTGGVSNKLIFGISIGVGVPVLIAIVALCICCCRRKRSVQTLEPYTPTSFVSSKQSPVVTISERK